MSRPKKDDCVTLYIVQQTDGGPVKIGITSDVESRLRSIQNACGHEVEILGLYYIGDFETHLHELGKSHRKQGEWFDAEVLDVIGPTLPLRHNSLQMARCVECGNWFAHKATGASGTKGSVCPSKRCRAAQRRRASAKGVQKRREQQRPIKEPQLYDHQCVVCDVEFSSTTSRRTLCDSPECRSEYGRRTAVRKVASMCSVGPCERRAVTRGYCPAHYQRLRQHGDVRAHIPIGEMRSAG